MIETINKKQRWLLGIASLVLFVAALDLVTVGGDYNPLYPFLWSVILAFVAMRSGVPVEPVDGVDDL